MPGAVGELSPGAVEELWESDLEAGESDGDQVVGDGHVVPGEPDDLLDLLGEHEHENRGSTVARCQLVAVEGVLHRLILLGRAESWAGAAAMFWQGGVGCDEPALDCPPEEPVSDQTGGGAGGHPAVEMALLKVAGLDAFGSEPVQKVDRDRDGLIAAPESSGDTCSVWFIRRRWCQRI